MKKPYYPESYKDSINPCPRESWGRKWRPVNQENIIMNEDGEIITDNFYDKREELCDILSNTEFENFSTDEDPYYEFKSPAFKWLNGDINYEENESYEGYVPERVQYAEAYNQEKEKERAEDPLYRTKVKVNWKREDIENYEVWLSDVLEDEWEGGWENEYIETPIDPLEESKSDYWNRKQEKKKSVWKKRVKRFFKKKDVTSNDKNWIYGSEKVIQKWWETDKFRDLRPGVSANPKTVLRGRRDPTRKDWRHAKFKIIHDENDEIELKKTGS